MSNSKNIAVNINGYDINPTGHYFLNTVRKVLSQSDKLCARSYITYLMQIGRLDPPIYPRLFILTAEQPIEGASPILEILITGLAQPLSRLFAVKTGNRNRGQKVKIVKSSFTGKTIRLNNEAEFKAITRLMDLSNTGNITAYKDLIDSNKINPRFSLIFKELGLNDPRNASELVIIE